MRFSWHFGLGRDLGLAFWAMTFFEATYGAYISVWPLWIEELGASITVVGLVLGSSGLIRPFVLGPGSVIGDHVDTRKLLIGARLLSIIGLLIAAFAGTWSILLFTVVTNALGELVFPAAQAYVADHATEDPVHAFNMVITIGPSAALIVTPLVSGAVIAIWGMPGALILAALLTTVALGFVWQMRFPRRPAESDDEATWTSFRGAFAHPGIRRIIVLHGLSIGALAIGVTLVSNFLEDVRGMAPATISILSAGAAIGTVLFGIISSRSRRLKRAPLVAATIAMAFTATGLLLIATQTAIAWISLAYVFRGGMFSAWALFLAAMGTTAPVHLRSRAFTVVEILGGSAMSFGPVVAALLYRLEPRTPLLVAAGLSVGVIALVLLRGRDLGAAQDAKVADSQRAPDPEQQPAPAGSE